MQLNQFLNTAVIFSLFNPSTLVSDQDRISPYNINTISSRQEMRIKKTINKGIIIQFKIKILQTNIMRVVWETVRRITKLDHGKKG